MKPWTHIEIAGNEHAISAPKKALNISSVNDLNAIMNLRFFIFMAIFGNSVYGKFFRFFNFWGKNFPEKKFGKFLTLNLAKSFKTYLTTPYQMSNTTQWDF